MDFWLGVGATVLSAAICWICGRLFVCLRDRLRLKAELSRRVGFRIHGGAGMVLKVWNEGKREVKIEKVELVARGKDRLGFPFTPHEPVALSRDDAQEYVLPLPFSPYGVVEDAKTENVSIEARLTNGKTVKLIPGKDVMDIIGSLSEIPEEGREALRRQSARYERQNGISYVQPPVSCIKE